MSEIEVPKTLKEHYRHLKKGYEEEDTYDCAHFNLSVMWINIWFLLISIACIIVGYFWSMEYDYYPTTKELQGGWVKFYGDRIFICQAPSARSTKDDLPSLIQLFDLNVPGNILFRMAIGYPMVVQIANSIAIKNLVPQLNPNIGVLVRVSLYLLPWTTVLEIFAAGLFATITTHQDSHIYHHKCKTIFAYASCLHMLLSTVVMGAANKNSRSVPNTAMFFVKALCGAGYCVLMYWYSIDRFRVWHICSSYLPRRSAYVEYGLFATYLLFYITNIFDLRNVHYVGMARTCAGETEPLDPANFQKGAKFEYCRAFEYNQRRRMKQEIASISS